MDNLLRVENLTKYFDVKQGGFLQKPAKLKAVDDVSFTIKKGQTYGIVGESGCGKTTLGKCVVRLYKPDSGKIFFECKRRGKRYFIPKQRGELCRKKKGTDDFPRPIRIFKPGKKHSLGI